MSNFTRYRKPLVVSSIIIASFVILILILQLIVSNIVEDKIEKAVSHRDGKDYGLTVDNVKVNLFTMTLIIKGISMVPDSSLYSELIAKDGKKSSVIHANLPVLRVRNIGIIDFIRNKNLDIGALIVKKAIINFYISGKEKQKEHTSKNNDHSFNLDSIPIKGIGGGEIGRVMFSDININVINYETKDTVFSTYELDLEIDDISLIKNEGDSTSFRFGVEELVVSIKDEIFLLPGGKYKLTFDKMHFSMQKSLLSFDNLNIAPRYSQKYMVGLSKYQTEIYNATISKTNIRSINLKDIIHQKRFYLSNVEVDGLNLKLFKDKRLPFDEAKRPALPQQLLKRLNLNLFIDSVNIRNSKLVYAERHELMDTPMEVTLGNFNVLINNVTSVKDSIMAGIAMTIRLKAKLQKEIPMGVDMYFPMKSVADTFMFSGYLGSGDMKIFNTVVLPVLGIKFHEGTIDRIEFKARANPTYSIGEMTMQYHDLQGEVQKQSMTESNKFLSWLANAVIIRNNPAKGKKARTVPMYFDRVMYKGLGNFAWKTLQSGIMATIIPTVENKVQNQIDTELGVDAKTIRKREREEKREERKRKSADS